MKKRAILFVVFLLLLVNVHAFAQDPSETGSSLPQLLDALPDPAAALGSVGSLYQESFVFRGSSYKTYLFPHPDSPEEFITAYTEAAKTAGYATDPGELEGYDVLRIYDAGKPDTAAMLFGDYQGYAFFMVPEGMNYTLADTVPEPMEPSRMVELGSEALAGEDYETAVRYLIKAAGTYIRGDVIPEETATEEPVPLITGPVMPEVPAPTEIPAEPTPTERSVQYSANQVYVVQEGDTCWSIAGQFGMDWRDFMAANGFKDECNIRIGDEVIIPGAEIQTPTPTPMPGEQQTYVVQAGDNCWSIAVDKFGVNFELFMNINNLTECNIGVGDEVIIPGVDQQMPTMTPIPLDQYTSGQIIQYVVEMNDSYNDIASKFNTTLVSIQQLNNVNVYTGFPQFGQTLRIAVNLVPTATPEP